MPTRFMRARRAVTVMYVIITMMSWLVAPVDIRPASAAQTEAAPPLDPTTFPGATETDRQRFQEQRDQLLKTLAGATEPMDQAQIHLALANGWLAIPAARSATACLVGMGIPEDEALLRQAGAKGTEHIAKARGLLAAVPELRPTSSATQAAAQRKAEADPRVRELTRTADELTRFAELLATFGTRGDPAARQEAWARAARKLATLREAPDETVAACARMWQAFAWDQAGRADRARVVLPPATLPPKVDPYDFLSRLLRCRLLTDEDEYVAANALLMQIRSSCPRWFAGQDASAVRERQFLALLLQCHVNGAWLGRLRQGGGQETPEGLGSWLDGIQAKTAADARAGVRAYTLPHAVPIVVGAPVAIRPALPASQPAATGTAVGASASSP